MPGGGELRAFFRSAQEEAAQAVEKAAKSIGDHIDKTAQNVRDSVNAIERADKAGADLFRGIGKDADHGPGNPGRTLRGGEPAPSGELPRTEWPDPKDHYPGDYIPSTDPPPHVDGPHEHPENWAGELNEPKYAPGRDNNCAECSRSLDNTWHGQATKPAAMADPYSGGEPPYRMGEWAGQIPVASSMSDVQRQLEELGPGSSAVVGCDWKSGGGHWFNAVNDGGTIKAVDGQSGVIEGWPPSRNGLHFDETMMANSDAIFFGADGKVVKS